jgi:hypothetical protein
MFIAALFIMASYGISLGTHQQMKLDKENVVYLHNRVLFSYKEE